MYLSMINFVDIEDENLPDIILEEICNSIGIHMEYEENTIVENKDLISFNDTDLINLNENIITEHPDYVIPENREELINIIKNTEIPYINKNNQLKLKKYTKNKETNILDFKIANDEILCYIARFINYEEHWEKDKLELAYNNIIHFENISDDFSIGKPTNMNPYSIPYSICLITLKKNNIKYYTDSDHDFFMKALKYLKSDGVYLRKKVLSMDRNELINFFLLDPDGNEIIKQKSIDHNKIKYYEDMKEFPDLYKKNIIPQTNEMSISLAALYFSIDISSSKYPLYEYNILKDFFKKNIEIKNIWEIFEPSDIDFKIKYQKNKKKFILKYSFNPIFTIKFYKKNFLQKILCSYGYSFDQINKIRKYELYNMCVNFKKIPNFHKNKSNEKNILFYGVKPDNVIKLTFNDLLNHYNDKNKLIDFENNTLSYLSIFKLKFLCKKYDQHELFKKIILIG